MEHRFDPNFYCISFRENVDKLERLNSKRLSHLVSFSVETWNGLDHFVDSFPYIEIGELDLLSGEIKNIPLIPVSEAPSRARMIVRKGDIIVSTTRPSRGAISFLKEPLEPIQVASTGFCVLRDTIDPNLSKEFLYLALRQDFSLRQMQQRSSGGNYPAITSEELKRILIPVPSDVIQGAALEIFAKAGDARKQKCFKAAEELASIDNLVVDALGIELPEEDDGALDKRIFYTKSAAITGTRIDPLFYSRDHFAFLDRGTFGKAELGTCVYYTVTGFAAGRQDQEHEDGIVQIRPTNFSEDRQLIFERNVLINRIKAKHRPSDVLKRGEVLFNNTNSQELVGKTVMFDFDGVFFCSNHVTRIATNEQLLHGKFLAAILNLYQRARIFYRICTNWNNQSGVNVQLLKRVPIPLPPLKVQAEIVEKVDAIYAEVKRLRREGDEILAKAKEEVERMILGEK